MPFSQPVTVFHACPTSEENTDLSKKSTFSQTSANLPLSFSLIPALSILEHVSQIPVTMIVLDSSFTIGNKIQNELGISSFNTNCLSQLQQDGLSSSGHSLRFARYASTTEIIIFENSSPSITPIANTINAS